MADRLPPLNALRTFEAAARHLSFTKAAEELFVTQTAVSHQIKALEEQLGVQLFRRLNRRLLLTDEGQLLVPEVREAFDLLGSAVRRLREQQGGALSISATSSFGPKWLASRIGRFQALHPEFEIQLTATPRLVDFIREGIDCGVRYGMGDWPGLRADRLFDAEVIPVTSPQLAAGLKQPDDLKRHTLIHVLGDIDDWRMWLKAAGVDGIDPAKGLKFDSALMALQSAAASAGVAIGQRRLVEEDLASGLLVAPFDLKWPDGCAYYFVSPESRADVPKIAMFRDWLIAEAEADPAISR
ncbi:MAG: transcriptional regulator GcvA [Geminicoccaceae bacterium]|nr:transcriptional regulator GcvA [Geminicoccaceae bacterium]